MSRGHTGQFGGNAVKLLPQSLIKVTGSLLSCGCVHVNIKYTEQWEDRSTAYNDGMGSSCVLLLTTHRGRRDVHQISIYPSNGRRLSINREWCNGTCTEFLCRCRTFCRRAECAYHAMQFWRAPPGGKQARCARVTPHSSHLSSLGAVSYLRTS